MSRYHWVSSVNSTFAFPGNAHNLGPAALAIPAGSTVKRFIIRRHVINFVQTGNAYTTVGTWYHSQSLSFTTGPYAGRGIYASYRAVKPQLTAVYDVAATQRIYSGFFSDGDETHFVDQRCSYGGPSSAAQTLTLLTALVMNGSGLSDAVTNFFYEVELYVLYYQ